MIDSQDRSGYFGASDTEKIIGRWGSKTWVNWWLEKIGIARNTFTNVSMLCGTFLEHRILDYLDIPDMVYDNQIIIEDLKLRVNLDGNTNETIYEVKTYNAAKPFDLPKKYIRQVQVQMFATKLRKAYIVAYAVDEADYKNFFRPIDPERLKLYKIEYDEDFICERFLPKIKILADCLKKGVFPCKE